MDTYTKLISGNQLYSTDIIEQMGKRHPRWTAMNGREKENILLHIMICMLLCNKEQINMADVSRKRKRMSDQTDKERVSKILHLDPNKPSTSRGSLSPTAFDSEYTGTSTSTTTTEDDLVFESNADVELSRYRFKMLSHMPMQEAAMREVCENWQTTQPSYQWDLVDIVEKKLVRVRYSYNTGSDMHKYLIAKSEIPRNSSLFIIEAGSTAGTWVDNENKAMGESKVTKFLLERNLVLESLGINDNLYLAPISVEDLFPSTWIKESIAMWEEDMLRDQFTKHTEKELYADEAPPKTITPSDFLDNLLPISESTNPMDCIKWKGKMLPESFCNNFLTHEEKDSDIITVFLMNVQASLSNGFSLLRINMKENSALYDELLTDVINIWQQSDKNTFSFLEGASTSVCMKIKDILGIGKKGIKHSLYSTDMKQPEYKENKVMKYSPWIEEVITGLAERDQLPFGYVTCPELLPQGPTDNHPIPTICEPMTTKMLTSLLCTNAGVQISKITNLYSRLGGAYGNEESYGKEMFKNVAMFPLLATLSVLDEVEKQDNMDRCRLVSGVMIRAPYHARRPTDRIIIMTIETLKKTDVTLAFIHYINNCLVYETDKFYIVIRQNSIMKEDSTYNSFITTALFTPINMLGCLTLENPNLRRNEDMVSLMEETFINGENWFIERAVEGIVFSMIGNSRDEGYFACLRKIFLVLLTWRKGKASASLDIATFCKKANECLIDNPISLYFHRTLLHILQIYKNRGARITA